MVFSKVLSSFIYSHLLAKVKHQPFISLKLGVLRPFTTLLKYHKMSKCNPELPNKPQAFDR